MRSILSLALIATLAFTAVADEKPAKGKNKGEKGGNPMISKLMTSLKDAGLSEEQMGKVKAAAGAFETSVKELREKGLTQELNKKRADAAKAARESGLKGKEMAAKVNEALTADEKALLEELNAATIKMKKAVAAAFTPEQLKALPEAVQKQLQTGPAGKGGDKPKGKKKKDAA